jgi:cell division control protein 6
MIVYASSGVDATMQIREYLKHRTEHLAKTSQRIKDFRVFDFNYIPERPLMREETKPLIDALLRYTTTGIPNHMLVFGGRGSGKTLTVKYVSNLLEQQYKTRFLYANCRQHNTSFKILASLLGVRPRGSSLDELWQRFCAANPGRTVLVLDEVDLISDKDRQKDILYLISRSPNNYMAVLLSNNPRFLGTLDESTRSTLQPELLHFRNYGAGEILEILRDRTRLGLVHSPNAALPQIAALTAKNTNSDVRVAIKTLYYLALEPQAGLRDLFQRARRDILHEVVADLNDRNLTILRAALSLPDGPVKALYECYRRLSLQMHEDACSYVYFYSSLSYLQSMGLILLLSTKVGRAYTNRIQVLFDPDLLETIWVSRFT